MAVRAVRAVRTAPDSPRQLPSACLDSPAQWWWDELWCEVEWWVVEWCVVVWCVVVESSDEPLPEPP